MSPDVLDDRGFRCSLLSKFFAGMKPDLPPLGRGEGFRRAPRERGRVATQSDFGL
jgi:hypothetical protein